MCGNAYQKAVNIRNTCQQNTHGELLIEGQGQWFKGLSTSLGQRIFWELMCILKLSSFVSWGKSSDFSILKLSRIRTLLNRYMEVDSVLYTIPWTEIFYGNHKNGYFFDDLFDPSAFVSSPPWVSPYLFSLQFHHLSSRLLFSRGGSTSFHSSAFYRS